MSGEEAPVDIWREPEVAASAVPEATNSRPVAPVEVVPELKMRAPDVPPLTIELAVRMDTAPDVVTA